MARSRVSAAYIFFLHEGSAGKIYAVVTLGHAKREDVRAIQLSVHEYRRRGIYFGFVSDGQRCSCGAAGCLVQMELVFSR
jgi:hypothetical protein